MGVIRKILGPRSKYDKTLPYTYMARLPIMEQDKNLYEYFFADTICGLVEYLAEHNKNPEETELFGVYQKIEVPLDTKCALSDDGKWLRRPQICKAMEEYFAKTLELRYKGHVFEGECSFEDRNTQGSGPF
ncbi:MAG: hypothetical protein H6627_05235 [Calditrichae bacterium]|nr:hypothetical protein [Calditrichota bacterium]MCB9057947.1 hypothetical protein [Calditrichia bacterium]